MFELQDPSGPPLHTGTRVEVRTRFSGDWARGFEVADTSSEGYLLRRTSDGSVLPRRFGSDDIRSAR